jgi:glycosyltransferase involved in cell wall biosynthesis
MPKTRPKCEATEMARSTRQCASYNTRMSNGLPDDGAESESSVRALRVLFLYPEAWLGSNWAVNQMVIRHAVDNGIEPIVLFDQLTGGETNLGEDDVTIYRLPLTRLGVLRSWRAVRQLIRNEQIDIIHVNDNASSLIAAVLLHLLTRTPFLVHHNCVPNLHFGRRKYLVQVASRLASANVAVSRFVSDGLVRHLGIRPASVTCVFNGVDTERFTPGVNGEHMRLELGFTPDAISVIEPARFYHQKGHADLIRAVAMARGRDARIEAALIGWEDPLYESYVEELKALAEKLGVADAVRFFPARPEAPQIIAAADIVCMPSIDEAFGLVVLEAQSSGRAFVGAASGGQPEIVSDGEDGLLVPPRSPEALADALVLLASDPDLRASLGNRGRQHVLDEFPEERVATGFSRVYRAIANGTSLPEGRYGPPQRRPACPGPTAHSSSSALS